MKPIMTLLKTHSWQRMIHKAQRILSRVSFVTGADMGSRMVKAVGLQTDSSGMSLSDFSIKPMIKRSLRDEPSDVELLTAIQEKIPISRGTIGTALSGPAVFVKSIMLPRMEEKDVREHLALELDRYISLDVHDVFWDVYHRKHFDNTKENQQEYFLVVAKKESVERQMEAYRQCGETVQFVDVDAFALVNVVTYNYGTEGVWLIAHIGPTGIVMVIIAQGEPVYIRKVAYETELYGDLLDQVSLPQASFERKNELGVSDARLLEQFIQETREQICETLESFSDHTETVIDRGVLLSGGYAVAPEMAEILAHSLRMPVHLMDPFKSIMVPHVIQHDPAFQQSAPLMSVAVGVALRGALTHD
jgi:type IV pilus assembly protein PilM